MDMNSSSSSCSEEFSRSWSRSRSRSLERSPNQAQEEIVERWTRNRIKLLLSVRLELENSFQNGKKSKRSVWSRVLRQILLHDSNFPFSCDEIIKKFTNLFTSYKRIKKRNNKSGRGASNWEYFHEFDAVYGTRHFVNAPPSNLGDSMLIGDIFENNTENVAVSTMDKPSSTGRKEKKKNEVLEYLKEQEKVEAKRHEEYVSLERDKLKIEKEKIAVLRELQSLLQSDRDN